MLRIFKKRITRTFCLKSILWIVSSFLYKKKTRDVCVCVLMFVCLRKKNTNENVAFEKNLLFVKFRNFRFLKSIFKLITYSFVNIKREKKDLFRWQNLKIRVYICTSLQVTKSVFYSLLYVFRFQIILFYVYFLCCSTF
jgi:hypothetical protein